MMPAKRCDTQRLAHFQPVQIASQAEGNPTRAPCYGQDSLVKFVGINNILGVKITDNDARIIPLNLSYKLIDALDCLGLRELESIEHPISKERQQAIMLCPDPIML